MPGDPRLLRLVSLALPRPTDLPLAGSRQGNLFKSQAGASWYLPGFQLLGDVDGAFGFAARQSGIDAQGDPFNQATLTFGLKKAPPPSLRASAPPHEIPLAGLTATLTLTATDPQSGRPKPITCSGTVAASGDGVRVTFSGVVGTAVLVAWQNLHDGGASIALQASYSVARPAPNKPGAQHPQQNQLVVATQPFSATVALGRGYAGVAYAPRYTLSTSTVSKPIAGIDDLKSFDTRQSEFSPLTVLGDVSLKYPSIARLYVGALSRTVVAVPAHYGIVRGSTGTAAACHALLDPSSTTGGGCKVQFTFVVAPVVSAIDLARLAHDVAGNPAVHDCTVVLPRQLDADTPPTLATAFPTAVAASAGVAPHTFTLDVVIGDGGGGAVASANLFIAQLIAATEPYLTGNLRLKLDDAYPDPVDAGVVLNFGLTSGSDELSISLDAAGEAVVTNASPLDLRLTRWAVASGGQLDVQPLAQALPAAQTATLAAGGAADDVLVDDALDLALPLTQASTARYLAFAVQDVQAVQYQIGVLASGVDFDGRGVASIDVAVTLNDLPQIAVPSLTLNTVNRSGNVQVALPLQYALTTLAATVGFTVHWSAAPTVPTSFTLANDFIDRPVLVLADGQIPPPEPQENDHG